MISGLELRFWAEVRAVGRVLSGVAAPFNVPAKIGSFTEIIAAGAFTRTLASNADISALADHDNRALLGRTRSGSLQLRETSSGLEYSLDLAGTAAGADIAALAARGELAGCSIGFRVPPGGDAWPDAATRTLRTIDLHHIAIVTGGDPAYGNTTAVLRHRGPPDSMRRARVALL